MVLPQSGNPISLLNLQLEYDDTAPTSLNEFYGQAQAPASGTIDLADFYAAASTAAVTNNLLFELDARNSSSWPGSGNTWYDTTSNNHDFSLVNGPTGTTVSGTTAIDFDGTNDYAQIADISAFPHGTSAISIEAYWYVDDLHPGSHAANRRFCLSKTSPSNQHISFGYTMDSTNVYINAQSNAGGNMGESYNLGAHSNVEGAWHHTVMTYDGSVIKFYQDGSLVHTSSSGKQMGNNTANIRLMTNDPSNGSWGNWVDGKLAVMRVYTDVLTASEVTNNRANCTGGATASDSVLTVTPAVHQGSAFTATFTFDQNVGLFDTNDVTVSGGSKGTFTAVSKKVYTLAITPSGNSNLTITVPASATFNAGNLGNNALSAAVAYSIMPTGATLQLDAGASGGVSGSNWYDQSGNGNHAVLYNGAAKVTTKGGVIDFDGSNDYALVTSGHSVGSGISTAMSAVGFFQFDSQPGGEWPLMRFGPAWDDFFQLGFSGNDRIRNLINGPAWTGSHDRNFTFGTGWRQLAFTYDANDNSGNRYKFYVDTTNIYSANPSGNINNSSTTGEGRIANWSWRYFNGRIMFLAVYPRALTSTEISTIYNTLNAR